MVLNLCNLPKANCIVLRSKLLIKAYLLTFLFEIEMETQFVLLNSFRHSDTEIWIPMILYSVSSGCDISSNTVAHLKNTSRITFVYKPGTTLFLDSMIYQQLKRKESRVGA